MKINDKKLVVVLKEGLEIGRAMNALSHAMLGFGSGVISKEDAILNKYEDADGNLHENISERAIVVLRAGAKKIRSIKNEAKDAGIQFIDFVDTMSLGTYEEEYKITKTKQDDKLDYWALILFGETEKINELTGKLSLYK